MKKENILSLIIAAQALSGSAFAYTYGSDQNFTIWNDASSFPNWDVWRRWTTIGSRNLNGFPWNIQGSTYGIATTWESDGVFLGLVDYGYNRKDAVLNWGDDGDDHFHLSYNGGDIMKFTPGTIFGYRPIILQGLPSAYDISLEIIPSSHPQSERASIKLGTWLIGQDKSGYGNMDLFFYNFTTQQHHLVIDATGKIAIGTDTPTHTLTVNGTIRTKEIIVDSGWADDVFNKDYHLRSLEETNRFINEHGHLPDIPSAKTVQAEGVSIGESQAMLLRKIEELTLHLIRQDQEIQRLKARLEQP